MANTGSKTGRLFFAVIPAHEQRQQLFKLAESIRNLDSEKLTAVDMMHMTLRYIGPVDQSIRQCLVNGASQIQASAFTLQINITDYWKNPQVTWVGPNVVDDKLKQLVNALEDLCQGCGVPAETRPYIPHITLLRRSVRHPVDVLKTEIVCSVEQFVLIESVSTPGGVKYHQLENWLLS